MREVIERLEALLEKATPGPWLYRHKSASWHRPPPEGTAYSYGESIMNPDDDWSSLKDDDIALIAEAINALPALLRLARAVEDAPEREVRLCCGHFAVSDDDGTDAEVESLEGQRVRLLPWGGV